MNNKNKIIRKIGNTVLNLFYYTSIVVFGFILLRVFVFGSYKIPTDSMEPAIVPGDYVLVNKLAYGARLFNLFAAVEGKQVKIKRMPGYTHIKNNDVVVFHIPHPNTWDKIEMNMSKYFIKRCIGVSGDTLRIVNGIYTVNSDTSKRLGNYPEQLALSGKPEDAFPEGVYNTLPWDTVLNWNIKDFGPIYIPKKGDRIILDKANALLYKKIIEWEKGYSVTFKNDKLRDNEKPLQTYTFTHNYYFMGGDKVENSQDSRYWGLLPDDLIVGKALMVWKSVNPYSGRSRRDRIIRKIE
ncbi:signal peptidase I [Petrimonas sulfuriphila]|jgi:signal peptidase I|uniref:signal peptidase I n=1 Tax=Dysgonomonadaceae TaxID=2005520 RepID=UPI00257C36D5|nr:signal peptidase I [Proteiniphilum sp. UBA5346]